jgi:hypothetical protein
MTPDAASFRADTKVAPLVERGLRDAKEPGCLFNGPQAFDWEFHGCIASPSVGGFDVKPGLTFNRR